MKDKHRGRIERWYESFLELPVPVVLVLLWLVGVLLIGLLLAALYLYWEALWTAAGA